MTRIKTLSPALLLTSGMLLSLLGCAEKSAHQEPEAPVGISLADTKSKESVPLGLPRPQQSSPPRPEVRLARSEERGRPGLEEATKSGGAKQSKDREIASPSERSPAEDHPVARAPGAGIAVSPSKPTLEVTGERYDAITENEFVLSKEQPLSTFSVDVDTASYSNIRRMLTAGQRVVPGAVRIEEMVNYFSYDYPQPRVGDAPFSVTTDVSFAPWNPERRLVLIGLQGKRVGPSTMPARNLVFLLDVSGSMQAADKLPLLKRSFAKLLDGLNAEDTVSIVVYAGASGVVLPPTAAHQRAEILSALKRLEAGGSTDGGAGIRLAYDLAQSQKRPGSLNRVILATDGDFNVGTTSESELSALIEKKRESGVNLTVLGFGTGNYNDSALEALADKGNGNYAYIDHLGEAQKVLVQEAGGTLLTIAKDVKIQVEFNPAVVGAYRLIGYENRKLENRDFNDDRKDAGDIGAGHSVTALYEVLTPVQAKRLSSVDALKYQKASSPLGTTAEMMNVKLRYKAPVGGSSQLLSFHVKNSPRALSEASENLRFASAVAGFGMLLRRSKYKGATTLPMIASLARGALGEDRYGYRREFLSLLASPNTEFLFSEDQSGQSEPQTGSGVPTGRKF